jgi:hypothetical protein
MRRHYRKTLSVLLAVGSTVGIALSLTAALGGFNAAITNPTNTFSSGTILLKEVAGSTTCNSTASVGQITTNANANCTANLFNDVGGNNAPAGTAVVSTVTLTNIGSIAASSFTMSPAACTAAANTATSPYFGSDTANFCGKVDVTVASGVGTSAICIFGGTTVPVTGGCTAPASSGGTLATFGAHAAFSLGTMAALTGTTVLTLTTQLDTSATNIDQGLTATVPASFLLTQ